MSPEAEDARKEPENEKAFILNSHQHWFTIRKFGEYWYNLNSTLPEPQFVSNTFLGMLLAQHQNDGYFVFVVRGEFPSSQADQMALITPRLGLPLLFIYSLFIYSFIFVY